MILRFSIGMILPICLMLACSPKSIPVAKTKKEAMTFNEILLAPGTTRHQIKLRASEACEFYFTCPDTTIGEKFPLIIALHWAGGGDVFNLFHHCLVKPGLSEVPAFIISPNGDYGVWFSDKNKDMILELVHLAKRQWPVDEDKIIVMGYSNGGMGAWYFASRHSDLFSAAIPMAATFKPQAKIDIPVYAIHGEADELFDVQMTRVEIQAAESYGSEVLLSVEPTFSHYMACDYVAALKKGLAWIMNKLEN